MTTVETTTDVFAGDDPAVPVEAGGQGSMAAPAPAEQQEQKDEGTVYLVLKSIEVTSPKPGDGRKVKVWGSLKAYTANNGNGAIRMAVADLPAEDKAGEYVAVPVRSWNPLPVKVETPEPVIRIGG